jgi:hypothetical protein
MLPTILKAGKNVGGHTLRQYHLGRNCVDEERPMILLLMRDGTSLEIPQGFDVVHKPGCIVCIDSWGASITSFLAEELLAYTLNPGVAEELIEVSTGTQRGRRRRRTKTD